MALAIVSLPNEYFPFFDKGKPIYDGQIFIGEPDLDPTIPANRKTVTIRQESGDTVDVPQPIRTSSGGVPTYNGSPAQILVDGNYSIKVLDKLGNQIYYYANFYKGQPITTDLLDEIIYDYITPGDEQILCLSIFPQSALEFAKVGDEVPANTGALRYNDCLYEFQPKASGQITAIDNNGATIGGVDVLFFEAKYQDDNALIGGDFKVWRIANAFSSGSERIPGSSRWSFSRENFSSGCLFIKSLSDDQSYAARVQRVEGNSLLDRAVLVHNLTKKETQQLVGKNLSLEFSATRSNDYTGSNIEILIQYSVEPMQAIVSDSGEYTNGNELVKTVSFDFSSEVIQESFSIPDDAEQMSIVVKVPWAGTATGGLGPEAGDFVTINHVKVSKASSRNTSSRTYSDCLIRSYAEYATSYPIEAGSTGRIPTVAGAEILRAVGADARFSVLKTIRSNYDLNIPPTVAIYRTTGGTGSRMTKRDDGSSVFAILYDLSMSGFTATNNAAVVDGDLYQFQWSMRGFI